jgi:aminopeptidase-like protein
MTIREVVAGLDTTSAGQEMHGQIADLFPLCRSITGEGVRETLRRLQARIPLTIHEIPSGTPAFDWTIPKEWVIREAHIRDPQGRKIVDFGSCNLHVVGYSEPVHATLPLPELRKRLHTLPSHPDWTPYRTSYYQTNWGFCIPHRLYESLKEGDYEVVIDSELKEGALTYGEMLIPGSTTSEILFATHICHPSMANDNLSGIVVAAAVAARLMHTPMRYSCRFLFIPGTIGSIAWLARNESGAARIRHGLVLAGLGDRGPLTYKRTRRETADIDRAVEQAARHTSPAPELRPFSPYGYDERQFNAPGFNLPVGCLMRTPYGEYPEYHTSADNTAFVAAYSLGQALDFCLRVVETLDGNRSYRSLNPKCEPQLGRRGLFDLVGGRQHEKDWQMALLWVLNYSDGQHDLLDIARRSGLPFHRLAEAAERLRAASLLAE